MSVTINVNGLTLCHRDSGGISRNTLPDVCKTPDKGIPLPYSNVSYSKDLAKGTTTVFADGGNMIANYGSIFAKSTGDERGSMGGIKSGTHLAEADWITHSFDVFFEKKAACRLTDKMFLNHRNTVNMAGLKQYSLNPAINLACNIFCKVLEKSKEPGAKKPFNFSDEAKRLAKSEFADDLAKAGMKAERSLWVRATQAVKEIVESTGRKLYENSSVLKAASRRVAAIGAKAGARAAGSAATGAAAGSVVPGAGTVAGGIVGTAVGVGMAAWTAWDLWSVAEDLGPLAKDIVKGWGDAVKVRPDLTTFGKDGQVQRILDFKFPGDEWRPGQKELYEKAAGLGNVDEINLKACRQCISIG